jgi:hypothetical protein
VVPPEDDRERQQERSEERLRGALVQVDVIEVGDREAEDEEPRMHGAQEAAAVESEADEHRVQDEDLERRRREADPPRRPESHGVERRAQARVFLEGGGERPLREELVELRLDGQVAALPHMKKMRGGDGDGHGGGEHHVPRAAADGAHSGAIVPRPRGGPRVYLAGAFC